MRLFNLFFFSFCLFWEWNSIRKRNVLIKVTCQSIHYYPEDPYIKKYVELYVHYSLINTEDKCETVYSHNLSSRLSLCLVMIIRQIKRLDYISFPSVITILTTTDHHRKNLPFRLDSTFSEYFGRSVF